MKRDRDANDFAGQYMSIIAPRRPGCIGVAGLYREARLHSGKGIWNMFWTRLSSTTTCINEIVVRGAKIIVPGEHTSGQLQSLMDLCL